MQHIKDIQHTPEIEISIYKEINGTYCVDIYKINEETIGFHGFDKYIEAYDHAIGYLKSI
jgi:hypothetical protein